ncbi:hypothetical protein B0T26DRAFT_754034 [Lasiosphaeria miniovina]|uniref:Uncharacterized protein n=1 Tax=Lasiosphaeria miniovina TaxID=1954250 RepID=A0AA40ADS3_9PEZI|nr:uncharacterized protein B0T26DRAFT_754034 [Lasiosphaeria miniovina]KAK0713986.1 hypothetical protein B0T26DRAFT_754034 [Lasiosphaeria miniovina]
MRFLALVVCSLWAPWAIGAMVIAMNQPELLRLGPLQPRNNTTTSNDDSSRNVTVTSLAATAPHSLPYVTYQFNISNTTFQPASTCHARVPSPKGSLGLVSTGWLGCTVDEQKTHKNANATHHHTRREWVVFKWDEHSASSGGGALLRVASNISLTLADAAVLAEANGLRLGDGARGDGVTVLPIYVIQRAVHTVPPADIYRGERYVGPAEVQAVVTSVQVCQGSDNCTEVTP